MVEKNTKAKELNEKAIKAQEDATKALEEMMNRKVRGKIVISN